MPGWFQAQGAKGSRHPALLRWIEAGHLEKKPTIARSDHIARSRWVSTLTFESYMLATVSGGDVGTFTVGTFSNYGDESVRRRIRAVVDHPLHFLSVLTELSYAAWHIDRGHAVTATEETGKADLVIRVPGLSMPIVADCKRVGRDSLIERFPKLITAANRQIKAHGVRGYGVAVLDVSDWVSDASAIQRTRDPQREPISDAVPVEISKAQAVCAGALRQHNSSVSCALIIWNEFLFIGPDDAHGHTLCILRRRCAQVRNANARTPFIESPPINGELTVSFWMMSRHSESKMVVART